MMSSAGGKLQKFLESRYNRGVIEEGDRHRGRWAVLGLVTGAVFLGMSPWLISSVVAPHWASLWGLTPSGIGWLANAVQLGFVAGTALSALLNLSDLLPSRRFFGLCAFLVALANGAMVVVPTYPAALVCRFLTGLFLAGVYPPAMKMVSTWFRAGRGLAIGTVVGGLIVGKAVPFLIHSAGGSRWEAIVLGASGAAALSALLIAALYRDGPYPFARRPFSLKLARSVLAHRETRLAIAGYLGHMWELYAMWTWIPAFLAASAIGTLSAGAVDVIAFFAIAAGGAGSIWGGWYADRRGRAFVVNLSMAASAACAAVIGLFFGGSLWILVPLAIVWGFFVVSDSAQFSAMVTESAPPEAVGTALTLQTSLGFLLSMATIQAVPAIVSAKGWPWAFAGLAIGPVLGIWAIRRLGKGRIPA